MKEATGETSMTVVTIIILAAFAVLIGVVFASDGPVKNWIEGIFTSQTVPNLEG